MSKVLPSQRKTIRAWLVACVLLMLTGCQRMPLTQEAKASTSVPAQTKHKAPARAVSEFGPAVKLATLTDRAINESSGIVASRSTPGLYWTHNDSGDGPFIYAFDVRGNSRGVWQVTGASAQDWEDIAAGPGPKRNTPYLYIGDIGDNQERRSEITVYRVREPLLTTAEAASTKNKPRITNTAESIRLRYPDGRHDAEALLVHPLTANIYIITKVVFGNAVIYEAAAPQSTTTVVTLKRLGELIVPSLLGGIITGGDISPDGRRVALCDYTQGYEIALPDGRADFNTIWKVPVKPFGLGERKQGESIAYRLDGRAVLATSEGVPTPLIQVLRK